MTLQLKDLSIFDKVIKKVTDKTSFNVDQPFNAVEDWHKTGKVIFLGETLYSADRDLSDGFCSDLGVVILDLTDENPETIGIAVRGGVNAHLYQITVNYIKQAQVEDVLATVGQADKEEVASVLQCSVEDLNEAVLDFVRDQMTNQLPYTVFNHPNLKDLHEWLMQFPESKVPSTEHANLHK